jgi:HK97 family phage prohead protease
LEPFAFLWQKRSYDFGMSKDLQPVPFVFDVDLKAANGDTAIELANGDLLIEGWGANYDLDREDEAFEEGAFTKGLKKFLAGSAPLCYHHDYKTVIGKVVDAYPVSGKGMWVKAIVDHQPEGSPWRHIYDGIRRGRISAFSCGGIFKRRHTKAGPRIFEVDLLEWSATPVSIGRGTDFSVVAGKALNAPVEGKAELTEDEQAVETAVAERELEREDLPQTPAEVEVAPEEDEDPEKEATEKIKEESTDEVDESLSASGTITADNLEDGIITSEKLAAGSITTEHLSDELRSRFSELKPEPEEPSTEELAAAVAKFEQFFETIGGRLGLDLDKSDAQKEGEAKPTSGPVIIEKTTDQ